MTTGAAELARFRIQGGPECGVLVGDGGSARLRDGAVEGYVIGACVQDPDFDFGRLTPGVLYRSNGRNLDATSLPVPSATPPIDVLSL